LLRTLRTPPSPRLSPASRARIATRLRGPAAPSRRRRSTWPVAVAAGVVLLGGGAVVAGWGFDPARRLFGGRRELPPPNVARPAPARVSAPVIVQLSPALAAAALDGHDDDAAAAARIEAAPVPVRSAPSRRPSRPRPSSTGGSRPADTEAPPEVAPAAAGVVEESRLLARALAELRTAHDPGRALAALDAYDRRFPDGSLAPEAAAARIDALLALGRQGAALARLEALPLVRTPRAAEMRVLRAELRAKRGNLRGALEDFGAVLAGHAAPDAVTERALYGRSSCRARLGDQAGAAADLHEYLRRYPEGDFAAAARRALHE
jgi:hypothetical protein